MDVIKNSSIKRYNEIVRVFTKHGLGFLLEEIGFKKKSKLKNIKGPDKEMPIKKIGEKVRLSCEELGTSFIKIAQFASTRQDIFPPEIIEEFEKLQTKVKPFPYEKVREILIKDFGDDPDNIFKEFNTKPIAAASIAQVHYAKLQSGMEVAVKVKRPDIRPRIETDLKILKDIAKLFTKHTKFGSLFDLTSMVKDFEKSILSELDFVNEAKNMEKIKENTKKDTGIHIPKVKWIYTNSRVLTMEYINATKISEYAKITQVEGADKKVIAKRLTSSILRQIIRDGFFHADPHPGNIMVKEDNNIYFIDFGMMGQIHENRKEDINKMFLGIATKNSRMIVDSIVTINNVPYQKNLIKFEKDIDILLEKYLEVSIKNIKLDLFMSEISKVAYKFNVNIMKEFLLISKCLSTLQGIVEKLDPEFNIYEAVKPIAKEVKTRKPDYDQVKSKLIQYFSDYKKLFSEIPFALVNFIKKIQDDNYSISLKIENDDSILKKLDSMINRISFSIVLLSVSIILGSVIIGNSISQGSGGSTYNDIIQTFGLIVGIIVILGLIISMIKSHKKK